MKNNIDKKKALSLLLVMTMSANIAGCAFTTDDVKNTDPIAKYGTSTIAYSGDFGKPVNTSETFYVISDAEGNIKELSGCEESDIPVSVKISYYLNGNRIKPEDLAGKSGKVTIRFDYDNHVKTNISINGKTEEITVPITMMSGMVLDKEKFSNVTVNSGKVTDDGSRFFVVGLAVPGFKDAIDPDSSNDNIKEIEDKLTDYVEITADVEDFALDMTMSVALPDLLSEFDITDDVDIDTEKLSGSADKLSDGMKQILDGSNALCGGLDTLYDGCGKLSDGTDKLADGALELKNGTAELDKGANDLSAGADSLSTGLNELSSNSDDIVGGAVQVFNALLDTATKQIRDAGLDCPDLTIDNYQEVLNSLISSLDDNAVYTQALSEVTAAVEAKRAEIHALVESAVKDNITSRVTEAVRAEVESQVENAVWEQAEPAVTDQVTSAVRSQVTLQVTSAVKDQVRSQVLAAEGLDEDTFDALDDSTKTEINNAIEQQMATEETCSLIDAKVNEQMESDEIKAMISEQVELQKDSEQIRQAVSEQTDIQMSGDAVQALIAEKVDEQMSGDEIKALIDKNTDEQIDKAISEAMASDTVQSKLTAASEGAQSLITLKASLDSYNAFYIGLKSYTDGVDQCAQGASALKSGAEQLADGADKLSSGATELYNGIVTLQDSIPEFTEGILLLRDGAGKLDSGLNRFNNEGISEICSILDEDNIEQLNRAKAVFESAKAYSAAHSGAKFIYKSGSVGEV